MALTVDETASGNMRKSLDWQLLAEFERVKKFRTAHDFLPRWHLSLRKGIRDNPWVVKERAGDGECSFG